MHKKYIGKVCLKYKRSEGFSQNKSTVNMDKKYVK